MKGNKMYMYFFQIVYKHINQSQTGSHRQNLAFIWPKIKLLLFLLLIVNNLRINDIPNSNSAIV